MVYILHMRHIQKLLAGPFCLTTAEIERIAPHKKSGVFALGICDEKGTFIPRVVGISCNDVSHRLRESVEKTYTHFEMLYTDTAKEAFEEWCFIYHSYCGDGGKICTLEDRVHPQHPGEESWKCPICHIR